MQRWLALPHGRNFSSFGAVAIVPWLLLCDRAGCALARAALPARRASGSTAAARVGAVVSGRGLLSDAGSGSQRADTSKRSFAVDQGIDDREVKKDK